MARLDDRKLGMVGFDKLNKQLKALEPRKQANAIRNSVRASMKPVEKEFKANIPIGTREHKTYKGRLVAPGFAKRSVRRLVKTSRDRSSFSGIVGVRAEAFYILQFWEYGSYGRRRNPHLSNAYHRRRGQAFRELRKNLNKQIIKQALKK